MAVCLGGGGGGGNVTLGRGVVLYAPFYFGLKIVILFHGYNFRWRCINEMEGNSPAAATFEVLALEGDRTPPCPLCTVYDTCLR